MKTYQYIIWGRDQDGNPWAITLNQITDSIVLDNVIILKRRRPGDPFFEKACSIHAIDGWEVKEEIV